MPLLVTGLAQEASLIPSGRVRLRARGRWRDSGRNAHHVLGAPTMAVTAGVGGLFGTVL
jgi:hypothetical protein